MKTFSINCPPYYESIEFCITENKEDARKYFIDMLNIDVGKKEDSVKGYCIKSNTSTGIWLPRIP